MKLLLLRAKRGGRHILSTSNLAVFGSPIEHSRSPILHAAAYKVLGLDWSYGKREVGASALRDTLDGLDSSWRGLSLTMPLKHEGFLVSGSVDSHGTYTQGVNTLSFSYVEGFRIVRGFNTDVYGITASLTAAGLSDCAEATIIGAGATALSALVALDELGAERVTVVLRDIAKAQHLTTLAQQLGVELAVTTFGDLAGVQPSHAVVSTVPGAAAISLDELGRHDGAVLLDVAYDVWPSPRAEAWAQRGGVSVSGLSMLAYQAIKQVRIFSAGVPDQELPNESEVSAAMFASVGLNEIGL